MKYLYCFALLLLAFPVQAEDKVIRLYQDADLSNHVESSLAIQRGIEVAFDEVNNKIDGYKVEFKYLNHRGNVVRSKRNYNTFLSDPNGLAIYSGIHSPPLIRNRDFINESKALTLVPWAAGGPITRYPSAENWVFRLSVDDTRAGEVIVDFAMDKESCKMPHLLLEDTPWGDSNLKNMSDSLKAHNVTTLDITRFGWNLKDQGARVLIRNIVDSGNDCIILVANTAEGAVITQAVVNLPTEKRIPIISHWGITGGNFHEKITAEKRKDIDLFFIQSCFSFSSSKQTDFSTQVFSRLQKISGGTIDEVKDLKSAVGFIHAYDLTKVFIEAVKQVGLSGDIAQDRDAVRLALETLKTPVQGLIKTYDRPYSVFNADTNSNAHEALHSDDFCMARYGVSDEIFIVEQGS
jgi:branched-chain amino acid transport system substrate-binding protein